MVRQMTYDVENMTFAYLHYDSVKNPVLSLTRLAEPYLYAGMVYYSKAEAIFYPVQREAEVRYPTRFVGKYLMDLTKVYISGSSKDNLEVDLFPVTTV